MARDPFSVTPLSAHTGAEIVGVDLGAPADERTRKRLNQAFFDHSVIAIRDQKLTAPLFLEAMKIFGEIFLQHNPRFAVPECPQIHHISNQDKFEDGRGLHPRRGIPRRSLELPLHGFFDSATAIGGGMTKLLPSHDADCESVWFATHSEQSMAGHFRLRDSLI